MRTRVVNGGRYRGGAVAAVLMALAAGAAWAGQPATMEPKPAAATLTERIPGTAVSFELVSVPAGALVVADPASPEKTSTKTIGPLWIGKTEVTWDQFDIFVYRLDLPEHERAAAQSGGDAAAEGADAVTRPSKPYLPPDRGYGHSGYPAITMSFHSATEYCKWLSEKTGHHYRLPTEAEWEYAARAGARQVPAAVGEFAWSRADGGETTHPVGTKAANPWGLFDTLGNVAEWCVGADGKPVVRGGSFLSEAADLGYAARQLPTPAWNASDPQIPKSKWWLADCNFVGFRVVRDGAEPAAPAPKTPQPKTPQPKAPDHSSVGGEP